MNLGDVRHTVGVHPDHPARRHDAWLVVVLTDDGGRVHPEHLAGTYAGVVGVQTRLVAHDGLLGNPSLLDEVAAHRGGFVIVRRLAIPRHEDHLRATRPVQIGGQVQTSTQVLRGLAGGQHLRPEDDGDVTWRRLVDGVDPAVTERSRDAPRHQQHHDDGSEPRPDEESPHRPAPVVPSRPG